MLKWFRSEVVAVLAFWVLAGGATASLAGGVHPLDSNLPTAIYSDLFPDDLIAKILEAGIFQATKGRHLVIVCVDGPTEAKARALHNLMHFNGLPEAKVLAGDSSKIDPSDPLFIEYTRDYDVPEFANVLNVLSESKEPRPWIADNYIEVTRDFFNRYPEVQVIFQANPASFVAIQESIKPGNIFQTFGLGPGGPGPGGLLITKYNDNTNVAATARFFQWVKKNKVPYFGIPSPLIADLSKVEEATVEAKRKLMQTNSHGNVMGALNTALTGFISSIRQNLFQNRGGLMEYVLVTDPVHGGWNQDATLTQVATDPARYSTMEPVSIEIHLDRKHSSGLGFEITMEHSPGSNIFMAKTLDVKAVADSMAEALNNAQITPNFSAAKALATHTHRPTAFIGFGAIDHEGALMGHVATGDLELVIAEGSRSIEIAERYRRTLAKYGAKKVEVAAGRGHAWQQMEAKKELGLELTVAKAGDLSKGILTEKERNSINELDPSSASAADQLQKFLERHDEVVIHDVASGGTLLKVLRRNKELAKKIAELHLMGGFRNATLVGSRDYINGEISRCWINVEEQEELFAILEEYKVPTWLASSHHSGGAANDVNMPLYNAALARAEATLPIARLQRGFREGWNQPLKAKLDPKTGLGPPLGYLGVARVALGPELSEQYFGSTRGHFVFHKEGLVDFVSDDSSSIRMLNKFERFGTLDQTMALLMDRAVKKAPRTGFARVMQVVKSCVARIWPGESLE